MEQIDRITVELKIIYEMIGQQKDFENKSTLNSIYEARFASQWASIIWNAMQ